MRRIVDDTHWVSGIVQDPSAAAMSRADEIERANHLLWAIDITTQQSTAKAEPCAAAKCLKQRAVHPIPWLDHLHLVEPNATELFLETQP